MRKTLAKTKLSRKIKILLIAASFSAVGTVFYNILLGNPNIANAIVAFGTLALAFTTALLIINTNEKESRDRKERLLNEIIQWAEDIDTASLTPDISLMAQGTRGPKLVMAERSANTLMRYGISRSKATSILTIVEERFKEALLKYFNKVLNELIEFMYIKQMTLSKALPNEKNFPKRIVNKMTKEIAKGDKSFDQLFEDHAEKLAESVRNLLIKANKIKARGE